MKREFDDDEREIRGAVCEILCFLSAGKGTKEQLEELKEKIKSAVRVFRKGTAVREKVS